VTTQLDVARVKSKALELGADLVGVASCRALEEHPPDPTAPQVPSRLAPRARSAVVMGFRMPVGEFLSDHRWVVAYNNQLVMRRMDHISQRLAMWLEDHGWPCVQIATEETDPELKRGSYGYLSMRHLAAEAGLGTFGLEANLLTPEYGPRLYVNAVLTELELAADGPMTEQVCIGEACSRCLLACPVDAVLHWTLDKRSCGHAAQVHGIEAILYGPLRRIFQERAPLAEVASDPDTAEKWSSIVRLVEAFGVCPRCIEVCPIGRDYHLFMAREHRVIPETTPAKRARVKEMRAAARGGRLMPGNPPVNVRWIGPDGFRPDLRRRAAARASGEREADA
jgi:epoxyqueuosine reductase QueG